jgi:NDP-sugar pyrophosphorylase family protein
MITKAMILAAGYATRLRPLSDEIPKACLPVLGRPLVHRLLDWIGRWGVQDVAVNLHHLPEAVRRTVAAYEGGRFNFLFSEERGPILLTAGAMAPIRSFLTGSGTLLLVNAKIVTTIDLGPVLEVHRRSGSLATLVLTPNRRREPFAHVRLDPSGRIDGYMPFAEAADRVDELLAFTGIHLLEPEVLDFVPDGRPFDTIRHLYPALAAAGRPARGVVAPGDWLEFSTPGRYLRNSLELLQAGGLENWTTWNIMLDPAARVRETVFGENVVVDAGATVERSLLLGRNAVAAGAMVQDCVVGPGVDVPPGDWRQVLLAYPAAGLPDDGRPVDWRGDLCVLPLDPAANPPAGGSVGRSV